MSRIRREPADRRLHRYFVRLMLLLMLAEWLLLALERSWLPLFLVTLIILTLLAPIIFWRRLQVDLPAEFHLLAVVFIFASFYLGEIHDFYARFWWWDIALHASAGFLMGILGFLLVYLLNESRRVELHMTPGFLAFFAFIFAVAIGSLWEIFEFAMDQLVGTRMQKPMLGDPSGLTDTMWDMIVNALGALLISMAGYAYLKRGRNFFVKRWIRAFIERNPGMFTR
ncbi:DUF2238 domain-containing protein [Marinospirillum alkaliphilum]|uniref:Membrane protein YjdF n=1 Tax=Marinospirillum alkaliphilum DSM 21637 TaxID=1122209 RepID=A0A1K1X094_9GAMM|nr:DUF2238 domain-containing protein [Marinospirillum alkaliphilum]SFX42723.1 hypothetical protein SAMN02745752_01619 [Marinospirillum alkaliphilum DSM 21637]